MAEVKPFSWKIGDLPSAQHRAGLAGLVLYLRWMEEREREPKGVAKLVSVDRDSASIEIDPEGLAFVFDKLYKASTELQARTAVLKNQRTKAIIEPEKETEVEETDPKTGKIKKKKLYWYPITIPHGGPIGDWDTSEDKVYLKLWRDMIWQIPRGIPAQRQPFDDRAEGNPTDDAAEAWKALCGKKPVELGSTLFFGAQAKSAENVPFKDQGRFEFLLHFQPYALQIYVPTVLVRDDSPKAGRAFKTEYQGYALVIPDVIELDVFCDELPQVLRARDTKMQGYRPRASVIELAISGAFELGWALRQRLSQRIGRQSTSDVLAGCDVLHLEKEGNNIRLRGSWRIPADGPMEMEHHRLRERRWSYLFRRQQLENLLHDRPFYFGFDRIAEVQPTDVTLDDAAFCRDARETFTERSEMSESNTDLPSLVYRVVGRYLTRKLDQKYQLQWEQVKDLPRENPLRKRFDDTRRDVARDAFLAARGRTGADFVEFFVGTLCSVDQGMAEEGFMTLAAALSDPSQRDDVRTLTLLALSARS